jgi:uncharacterized RDD family membrane protein YckC
MQCPVCATVVIAHARNCEACGTKFASRRVLFGAHRSEFSLTPEEEGWETGDDGRVETSPLSARENQDERLVVDEGTTDVVQWGGFLRRAFAFVIDLGIVCLICAILLLLSFIGYKVGLAAHGRSVSAENSPGLLAFLVCGWTFLMTSYFVIFHGMEGQTVGKWLLGLRVTGKHGASLSYKRALLRWLSELFLAPFVISILWIIWSREKRGWHDYLAGTWVVREQSERR